MKKIIFILSFFISIYAFGQKPNSDEVLSIANNFIKSDNLFENYTVVKQNKIQELVYKNLSVGYVVNLKPQGFVIITSSKNIYPVFGYSTENNFNFEKTPALSILLDILYKEKLYISTRANSKIISHNRAEWQKFLSNPPRSKTYDYQYGYWMSNVWGGVNCYDENGNIIYVGNYFTPNHYSPGCVATSTSQVLKYYNWPPRGTGTHTDVDNSGSSQGSYYAKFVKTEYQWDKMLDEYYYKHSTDEQRRAMGRLAYHCAVATDMDFEYTGSTANIDRIPNALTSYFRATAHYETVSWSYYGSRLRSNLRNAHPVILAARADNGDEHAFVCDGYRYNEGEEKYYHLNMGWWNAYGLNGWYRIFNSNFNVGGYNTLLSGVFDIMPKPYMNKTIYTSDAHSFYVRWQMPKNVNVTAYQLEESYNNGSWTIVSNSITDTFYLRTVTNDGLYKYRVKPQIDSTWYADTYSNYVNVPVGKAVYLYFDGNDSFFANDNIYNDLDVDSSWTFETWAEVDSYNDNDWSVIMDRQTVFSLYLINDYDADFAVRFAVRNSSGDIIASLRSDSSDVNLQLGQWFHVAVSFDGTTARLFINGNLVDEEANPNFILTHSTNALNFAARYWGGYSRYLTGRLDEIRVSDVARYTDNFCPDRFAEFTKDDNTRLLLHLDNYTGTSLYDESNHILGINLRSSPNDAAWASSSCPIVLTQGQDHSTCGEATQIGVSAYNADTWQWQINNNGNYTNTTDGSVFSGSNTDTLLINPASLTGTNYFRCIVSNSWMFTCSDEVRLNVFDNCTVWDGTTWSNGDPDANKTAVFDADYSVMEDMTADNIIIHSPDTLFILPGKTFSTSYLENYGVLMLNATENSRYSGALKTNEILNYGDMIAEKTLFAIDTQQIKNQQIINSPLTSSTEWNNVLNPNVKFLETTASPENWTEADTNGVLSNRKAYLIQTKDNEIITFKGTFNSGEIEYDLQKGWNLLYNPFPCPIDWLSDSGWEKQNIKPAIYTLSVLDNNGTQNFSVFDGNSAILNASRYINSMQGFFVYANDDNAVLKINPDAQVKTSDIQENINPSTNILRFEFENPNGDKDEAIIYFSDNYARSYKIKPLSENQIYTYMIDGSDILSIFGIATETPDTAISVGFKTYDGGDCVFRVKEFDFDVPVILKDNMTGDTTLLGLGKEYNFTAGTHEPLNRFKIYFGNYNTSLDELHNDTKIWCDGNTIFVKSAGKSYVIIYNSNGQKILEKNFVDKIDIKGLQTGIYTVLTNGISQKVSIIK